MGDLVVMQKPVFTVEERNILREFPLELEELEHEEKVEIVAVKDFVEKLRDKGQVEETVTEFEIIEDNG